MKRYAFSFLLAASLFSSCNDCNKPFWKKCPTPEPTPENKSVNYKMTLHGITTTDTLRQVNMLIQVTDQNNIGVDDLTKESFSLLQNNLSIDTEAGLTINKGAIPTTVNTILLLDISSSVTNQIPQLKEACNALIDNIFPNQKIAIYTFDKDAYLIQNFTNDKDLLKTKINSIPSSNLENSTNLFGSLTKLTNGSTVTWDQQLNITQIKDVNLILFTDGRHNANALTLQSALSSIGNKKVYVAALQSIDLDEASLKQIAVNGGYYLSADINQLKDKFNQVQAQIKRSSGSLYYMYFRSTISDPTPRSNSLKISIKNNQNTSSSGTINTTFNSAGFK